MPTHTTAPSPLHPLRRPGSLTPLAAAVTLALATLQAAHAQEAGKLETVTVTAERRTENIKDVPSSISTLSGEALDVLNSSGQDVRALSGRAPSLNIESSFGRAFPRFYIRGYGNTDFRLNASQPVSLIYDDVVQENPILKGFPAFDLERVEVIAGPQGTLFGRNTPAGVVKFNSVAPSPKQDGYVSLSYGSDDTTNLEGAFNLPLGGDWAARVSLLAQHKDNWVDNTFDGPTRHLEGYDDRAVRVQALYAPSKDFSALFNVHNRELEGSARLFRASIIKPGSNDLVDGFDKDKIAIDGLNDQVLSNTGASARLKWALPGLSLYSITGYETLGSFSRGDVDGSAGPYGFPVAAGGALFPSETADALRAHEQLSQEFRAESANAGPLNWQAGIYFFHETYRIDSTSYDSFSAGNPLTGLLQTTQKNNSWAAFGSLNYSVTPQLKLRGGLRYTHDKKDLATQPALLVPPVDESNGLATSTKDAKVSWDFSGTYALTPDTNLYARVATGYRGSSIQPAGQFNALSTAEPETNTSVEAGIKADLFERRARASFSVYHYQVKDQQLTAVGGAGNGNVLLNAKKTVGSGAELTLDAYATENLLLKFAGSYNKTQIKDGSLAVSVCAICTVTDPLDADGKALIDGNALPNAPKWIANLSARYSIPTSDGEWYVYTDWAYRSKVNFFLYESVEFTGKSLVEGGLRVGYVWGNGKYEAALFGRNITNQVRVTGAIDFNNLTGFINEPRMVGAQFKASF
ncbi:MAG TPA: TonB-dependent receptor [Ideonella sp.]|nr:TonB-dependent receptor [Ideonella sp.]